MSTLGILPTLAAAVLMAAVAPWLAISVALAEDRSLKPIYDFIVETNGTADKEWRIFAPPQKTRLLLISPAAKQYLLVAVADKSVRPVDRSLTKTNPDGTVDILAGGVSGARIIPLVQNGSSVSFSIDGRSVALKPRPPLLGPHTLDDLITDRPNFGEGMKKYQPEPEAVSFLKNYEKPTEIEVFFGSWCPICEAWVPRLLKSMQAAANSNIQCKLIGVSKDFQTDADLARQKGIRGLPTFIIRQNGIEVGRIVGSPQNGTVEAAVADVLKTKS